MIGKGTERARNDRSSLEWQRYIRGREERDRETEKREIERHRVIETERYSDRER